MSLSFPNSARSALIVGRTPWSARVPLDPPIVNVINIVRPTEQADEGVGRGPGGPPHNKTKWHWASACRARIHAGIFANAGLKTGMAA